MKKLLVLGVNGMLGSMVFDYLNGQNGLDVYGTYAEADATPLTDLYIKQLRKLAVQNYDDFIMVDRLIAEINPAIVINCIGIIKQSVTETNSKSYPFNATMLNAALPQYLSRICQNISPQIKIIQIATDCVYDGMRGWYREQDAHSATDVYAQSKSLGEVVTDNFLNIRCSIIGPELIRHKSLMDWVVYNGQSEVNGYVNHLWNGITTLQFASLCGELAEAGRFEAYREKNHILHYIVNEFVSKHRLVEIINNVFALGLNVKRYLAQESINRTLASDCLDIAIQPMEKAVQDLADYMKTSQIYKIHKGINA